MAFFAVCHSCFGVSLLFFAFFGKPGCSNMLSILVIVTYCNEYKRFFSFQIVVFGHLKSCCNLCSMQCGSMWFPYNSEILILKTFRKLLTGKAYIKEQYHSIGHSKHK